MDRPVPRACIRSGLHLEGLRFGDRAHGRTAPSFVRKHCDGCGRTLPNKSRSWVCTACYPEYRAFVKRRSERLRRQRARVRLGR